MGSGSEGLAHNSTYHRQTAADSASVNICTISPSLVLPAETEQGYQGKENEKVSYF